MTGPLNDFLALIQEFLGGIGVENEYIQLISGVLALVFILAIIGKQIISVVSYFLKRRRNRLLSKDLHPFFSAKEVESATKYYIDTQFQNVPPSEDEEPSKRYIAAARQPLLPLFLKRAFNKDLDDNRYYLVLADSGMGKTTFMINLYLSYKYKRNWFWQKPKHDIKLFPMGHPRTISRIKEMSTHTKENTILLLDAFDEDNKAVLDYESRLKEILDLVWEFREVVITCRTQFFPSSDREPAETGKFRFGPEGGQYNFQKIYISVFSEGDIRRYLKKKFKTFLFFRNSKYLVALGIVLKSPNLMMRPMLLSHIDDLVEVGGKMNYGFQIYEALIEQWLSRESNKAGIRKKYGDRYKTLLFEFSRALARDLYLNRGDRNNQMSLRVNEIIDNPNGLQLKDIEGNNIEVDKYDQGSRSLLNRNARGEYKFSHKSILEYFLALEVYENEDFRRRFKFESDLDSAKRFFLDMMKHGERRLFLSIKDSERLGLPMPGVALSHNKKGINNSLVRGLKILSKDSWLTFLRSSIALMAIATFTNEVLVVRSKSITTLTIVLTSIFFIAIFVIIGFSTLKNYLRFKKDVEELRRNDGSQIPERRRK